MFQKNVCTGMIGSEIYLQGDDSKWQDESCCNALSCSYTFHDKTSRPSNSDPSFALRALYPGRASALPILWSFEVGYKVQKA